MCSAKPEWKVFLDGLGHYNYGIGSAIPQKWYLTHLGKTYILLHGAAQVEECDKASYVALFDYPTDVASRLAGGGKLIAQAIVVGHDPNAAFEFADSKLFTPNELLVWQSET